MTTTSFVDAVLIIPTLYHTLFLIDPSNQDGKSETASVLVAGSMILIIRLGSSIIDVVGVSRS